MPAQQSNNTLLPKSFQSLSKEVPLDSLLQSRCIKAPGRGPVPDYRVGSKVTFHFRTVAIYDENQPLLHQECSHDHNIVIDDSKSNNKPMELVIGKQFKFPLWEEWIKQMRVQEVSELTVDWCFCGNVYPLLSRSYRNFSRPKSEVDYDTEQTKMERTSNHCCGMKRNYGYKDLDCLVEYSPKKLQFTIEVLKVESPEEVDKEIWLMNEQEMRKQFPLLRQEGNQFFAQRQYEQASLKYRKALDILEQLQLREKPNDEEWNDLERDKVPLLSNLAQCELFLGNYYQALTHSDSAFKKDPTNVKALYRRAKANAAVWNVDSAREDFNQVQKLEPSLANLVKVHLEELELKVKQKNHRDSQLLRGKLFG